MVLDDKEGNRCEVFGGRVYLHFANGSGTRVIGKISGGVWHVRRSASHFFRKLSAWGINHCMLANAELFGIAQVDITVADDVGIVRHGRFTPRQLLSESQFLHFQRQGFELQVFVPGTALSVE